MPLLKRLEVASRYLEGAITLRVDYHGEPMTGEVTDWAVGVVKDPIDTVRAKIG